MDPMADERSATIARLAADLPEAENLVEALTCLAEDPAASLTKSRLTLEGILIAMFNFEKRPVPSRPTVGKLLNDPGLRERVPATVYAAMEYVNRVASAEGAHVGRASVRTATRVLDHMCDVLEWYSSDYLACGLVDNFGNKIGSEDALLLYASTGGTCRCAMANVITRGILATRPTARKLCPMSTAVHQPTQPTISDEAAAVVLQELKIDVSGHRTIQLDRRYARRADLLLAMDSKLLAQLQATARDKTVLFSEFYGGTGNIEDPWHRGLQAYHASFYEIRALILDGFEKLEGWLTSGCTRRPPA